MNRLQGNPRTQLARRLGEAMYEPWRFQFGVRAVFITVLYFSIVSGWLRLVGEVGQRVGQGGGYEPTWFALLYPGKLGLCSMALILYAGYLVAKDSDFSNAWNHVVIAWILVGINVLYGVVRSFRVIGEPGPTSIRNEGQIETCCAVSSAVSLPLLLTLPLIFALIFHHRWIPSGANRCTTVALAAALFSVALFVSLLWILLDIWAM